MSVVHKYANRIRLGSSDNHTSLLNILVYFRIREKRFLSLPLPFSSLLDSSIASSEASRIRYVVTEATSRIFKMLHLIQKNLEFWQSQDDVSNAAKFRLMILGRGPIAFFKGSIDLVRKCVMEGISSSIYRTSVMAKTYIFEKIAVLKTLRNALASFLAEIYMDVDKQGGDLLNPPFVIFHTFDNLFFKFEEVTLYPLLFEKILKIETDYDINVATGTLNRNMEKLESYVLFMAAKHRRLRRITRYWIRYTFAFVGFTLFSSWINKHWVEKVKEFALNFVQNHVEQPLVSIRDESIDLFQKSKKRRTDIVIEMCEKEMINSIPNLYCGWMVGLNKLEILWKLYVRVSLAALAVPPTLLVCKEIGMAVEANESKRSRQRYLLLADVERKMARYQVFVDEEKETAWIPMLGILLYSVNRLFQAVEKHAKAVGEWNCLKEDFVLLTKPSISTAYKLTVISRMGRVYECLMKDYHNVSFE